MPTFNVASLLADRNVKAFLRVIREGESNQIDEDAFLGTPHSAYRAMYHPTRRKWWQGPLKGPHPRQAEPLPDGSGRVSSAFGAYQFVWTTWQDIAKRYGLNDDIAPFNQDCMAAALLYDCGALDHVMYGRLPEALAAAGRHWASLPDSSLQDGGSKVARQRAEAVWKAYGGGVPVIVATAPGERRDPPAPIEERSVQARPEDIARITAAESPRTLVQENAMPAPLLALLPVVMQTVTALIPALSTLFGKNAEKVTDKIGAATAVVDIITKATGAVNAQQAVEAIAADPVKLEAAKVAVLSDPVISTMLIEAGGGGITGARAASSDPGQTPLWRNGAFWISLLFVGLLWFVAVVVLIDKAASQELKIQIVQAVIGLCMVVGGFWLGSSFGSGRKTDLLADRR